MASGSCSQEVKWKCVKHICCKLKHKTFFSVRGINFHQAKREVITLLP